MAQFARAGGAEGIESGQEQDHHDVVEGGVDGEVELRREGGPPGEEGGQEAGGPCEELQDIGARAHFGGGLFAALQEPESDYQRGEAG